MTVARPNAIAAKDPVSKEMNSDVFISNAYCVESTRGAIQWSQSTPMKAFAGAAAVSRLLGRRDDSEFHNYCGTGPERLEMHSIDRFELELTPEADSNSRGNQNMRPIDPMKSRSRMPIKLKSKMLMQSSRILIHCRNNRVHKRRPQQRRIIHNIPTSCPASI